MIKEVNIAGQMRPVSFEFSTIALFGDLTGHNKLTEVQNLITNIELKDVKFLVWAALKMGYKKAGRENVPTVDDVENWIDDDISLVTTVMGVYAESQVHDKKKETVKKKGKS